MPRGVVSSYRQQALFAEVADQLRAAADAVGAGHRRGDPGWTAQPSELQLEDLVRPFAVEWVATKIRLPHLGDVAAGGRPAAREPAATVCYTQNA